MTARDDLFEAVARLGRVKSWNDEHPENPYADADDEYSSEMVAEAMDAWLDEIAPLMFVEMKCSHQFDGMTCGTCWGTVQAICAAIKGEMVR